MRLSKLQKHILLKCFDNKNCSEQKIEFYKFYKEEEINNNKIKIQVGIQKSIDNLVGKDLVVAYGHKTAKKWSVDKVKLTPLGKQRVKELIKKRQSRLPIK